MYVLKLHCDDKPGIVAAVAGCLAANDCNIDESAQFNDPLSGQFFMRVVFSVTREQACRDFQRSFTSIVTNYAMRYEIHDLRVPVKTLLLVSKADHCLNDLLYRYRKGDLPVEITSVVSNHETCRKLAEDHGLTFHYLPLRDALEKPAQEAALREIIAAEAVDLIVLARYMQVLSESLSYDYAGRIINIHHSFLPGFKGAQPYRQAYERGVKLIGATAHFVNEDLDEGPIIEQEVARVTHSDSAQQMQTMGRDIESRVLARAVKLYAQSRIFLHDSRTVIL